MLVSAWTTRTCLGREAWAPSTLGAQHVERCFSSLSGPMHHLGTLINVASDSVGLGRGPEFCSLEGSWSENGGGGEESR